MYLLGFDIGSSSIKVALVNAESKETISVVQVPQNEMPISAPEEGWAEQGLGLWWRRYARADFHRYCGRYEKVIRKM